jgi:hypothetical protein
VVQRRGIDWFARSRVPGPAICFAGRRLKELERTTLLELLDLHRLGASCRHRSWSEAARPDRRPLHSAAEPLRPDTELGAFIHGLQSIWLPATLLESDREKRSAEALFAATRHWAVALHFNKGLAGTNTADVAAARDTATTTSLR